jgi:cation transport regulator ChaC
VNVPANTIEENRLRVEFDESRPIWLFGYGSLIFKADFPFIEKCPASISGWERRFWQGSHDHRGTASMPGRVVTLVRTDSAICKGMAYLIEPETLSHLDYREKNGYLRFMSTLDFDQGPSSPGLVYIATEDNPAFLGSAPEWKIAAQIARASGPSGRNIDYLFALANALRELGADDPHVFKVESYLKQISSGFGLD